ncbi:abc transporter g family member 39 [Quercus suber]|uniref:Abc transporter g family member 39 n=1 Tax=Quercus suber TaxID=58331 RepID=A0AAW0JRM3_QUESU
MKHGQIEDGGKYYGALFFNLISAMFNGMAELSLTMFRLLVFFKQRDFLFHPAWAFGLTICLLRIPLSLMESGIWTCLTYGFAPAPSRKSSSSVTLVTFTLLLVFVLGGFIVVRDDIAPWMIWGYYISPLMYGQNAIAINEFLDKRWSAARSSSKLANRHFVPLKYLHLIVFTFSFLQPNPDPSIPEPTVGKVLLRNRGMFKEDYWYWFCVGALLGFSVLFNICFIIALTFLNPLGDSKSVIVGEDDNKKSGKQSSDGQLQMRGIEMSTSSTTPSFQALVGVSGAGKTILMDVLTGRKTGGYIEGSISISGYLKNQATFARMFVEEVMDLVELNPLRNSIVGLPGVDGLSTEQRKRLTIAVEFVANPSIIFMDEPTSGLDARAAAIVMRTLLLMKRGGQVIFAGPLGHHSHKLIEYFEAIPNVVKIKDGYNPATWMLEISSPVVEGQLDVDFAEIYANSELFKRNQELIKELSTLAPGSKDLYFPTKYSQSFVTQSKACFWKQYWSYWRNPRYNAIQFLMTIVIGVIFGLIFWKKGDKTQKEQDLLNLLGAMYAALLFLGSTNTATVQSVVAIERTVFYCDRAAGMYSALPYALAQCLGHYGLVTCQVGEQTTPIEVPGQGYLTVKYYLKSVMALNMTSLELLLWPALALSSFSSVFVFGIKFLNFQRR